MLKLQVTLFLVQLFIYLNTKRNNSPDVKHCINQSLYFLSIKIKQRKHLVLNGLPNPQ